MKFFQSIRWRLEIWHGLLLVVVLAGFGFTAWQWQRASHLQRVDQELEQRISAVAGAMPRRAGGPEGRPQGPPGDRPEDRPDGLPQGGPPPLDGPPFDGPQPPPMEVRLSERDLSLFSGSPGSAFYYVVWRRGGEEGPHSATAPAHVPRPERHAPRDSRIRGTLRERFHVAPLGEIILVGRDIGDELAGIRRFAWLLTGAGIIVLALGLAGGWWIASRALRPIGDISAAAAKISSGDLAQRIQTDDTSSELGDLARVLNHTFARLQASFARQAQFTADAAHELRTPVTVMLTHAQNGLGGDCANEEHREAFEASQRAAQRMRRLIESLMILARLDSGDVAAAREACDLHHIAAEAIALLRPVAKEHGVTLEAQLSPARCEGNPEQLGQVVTNLVSNAIYYNRPGGSVRVTVAADAGAAVLAVSDTGLGIAPEDLPHIFERFYRADKARSSAAGRTGLGLPITQAIVEAHHGAIEVATVPGEGSTFTVRLRAI